MLTECQGLHRDPGDDGRHAVDPDFDLPGLGLDRHGHRRIGPEPADRPQELPLTDDLAA
jgi:hypothetical protein